MGITTVTLADVARDFSQPEFPRVRRRPRGVYLEVQDGREYRIPADPIKAMGLLHHLAQKTWTDREFFLYALSRMSAAMGWEIHPF